MSKKKAGPDPERVLSSLLQELADLKILRDDDSISGDLWLRKANLAQQRGERLPKKQKDIFMQALAREQASEKEEREAEELEAKSDSEK